MSYHSDSILYFGRQDGTVGFQAKVPDTITTWVLDAFAVNDVDGLGVARESAKVRFCVMKINCM